MLQGRSLVEGTVVGGIEALPPVATMSGTAGFPPVIKFVDVVAPTPAAPGFALLAPALDEIALAVAEPGAGPVIMDAGVGGVAGAGFDPQATASAPQAPNA